MSTPRKPQKNRPQSASRIIAKQDRLLAFRDPLQSLDPDSPPGHPRDLQDQRDLQDLINGLETSTKTGSARETARFVWWLMGTLGTGEYPAYEHHTLVRRALDHEAGIDEANANATANANANANANADADWQELALQARADEATCDRMARALLDALSNLRTTIGMDEPAPKSEAEAIGTERLGAHKVLLWDAKLAQWLAKRYPDNGRSAANQVLEQALARWNIPPSEPGSPTPAAPKRANLLWGMWIPTPDDDPRFLRLITHLIWVEEIRPWWTHKVSTPRFEISTVVGAPDFVALPKVVPGISWAFGTSGIEIDGDEYATEPDFATKALVPRVYGVKGLLPDSYFTKPHTTFLPVEYEDEEEMFAVTITKATQGVIRPAAGKVALLLLASAVKGGSRLHAGPQRIQLDDLTKRMNPGKKRIQKSHHVTVVKGLEQLRTLFLYLRDGTRVQCFDIPKLPWTPDHARHDVEVLAGVHHALIEELSRPRPKVESSHNRLAGHFLLNLTGTMALPLQRPLLLRLYVRAAASWNAYWKPGTSGLPDPERVPVYSADEWALLTNTMEPAALEYLQSIHKSGRRQDAADARSKIRQGFEELNDRKLIRLRRAGRNKLQALWPEAYLEAWQQARKVGRRRPDP